MDCKATTKNLVSHFYGELDIKISMKLHKHLSTCEQCANEEIELRKTLRQLDRFQIEVLPEDFDEKLRSKLPLPKKRISINVRRIAYAMAATILIFLGVQSLINQLYLRSRYSEIRDYSITSAIFKPVKSIQSFEKNWGNNLINRYNRLRKQ